MGVLFLMRLPALLLAVTTVTNLRADPPDLVRFVRGVAGGVSIQPYAEGNVQVNVLGMSAISGASETWLVEFQDSFASLEDTDKRLAPRMAGQDMSGVAQDDVLPPSRTLVGLHRPWLSYRPEEAVKTFSKARYVLAAIYRIRTGSDFDFAELVKVRRARNDSVNLDRPEIAYQIISGAPAGMYVFVTPLASLRSLDEMRVKTPVYAEGLREAAITAGKKAGAAIDLVEEHLMFRIEPGRSRVSDEFASGDASFWKPDSKQ